MNSPPSSISSTSRIQAEALYFLPPFFPFSSACEGLTPECREARRQILLAQRGAPSPVLHCCVQLATYTSRHNTDDYAAFARVNSRLLNPPTPFKSVPLRIYIPSTRPDAGGASPGSYKVMQTLVPPRTANGSKFCSLVRTQTPQSDKNNK